MDEHTSSHDRDGRRIVLIFDVWMMLIILGPQYRYGVERAAAALTEGKLYAASRLILHEFR